MATNYKFFNKKFLSTEKAQDVLDSVSRSEARDVLLEAKNYWDGLHGFRLNRRRNGMFTFGDQWKDRIPDPDRKGRLITEEESIRKQGKVPLKNNLIRKLTKSVIGIFRGNRTEPVAAVRDSDETKIGEMMSIALQAVYQLNQLHDVDAEALQEFLISSSVFQKVKYDLIPTRDVVDGHVENKNPARMFWNPDMDDIRGWDMKHIGEIHDLRIADVVRAFAKSRDEAMRIREMYRSCSDENAVYAMSQSMSTERTDSLDFLIPQDLVTCRVIESWRRESKESLYCHDWLTGEVFWLDADRKSEIGAENAKREADAQAHGVLPEDVLRIEYEWKVRQYWYFRFMTPMGEVLKEGESPYWHSGHPYVFRFYGRFDGKPHSFVEDVIDQQKMINRMLTLNDFVISSGAKNPVFVDSEALDGKTVEEFAEDYVKVGSVMALKLRQGKNIQDVINSPQSNNSVSGTYEMINMMMRYIDDISGVHDALQGKAPASGTPGYLYQQETQNAAINLVDVLENFNTFRTDRDTKLMKVIQQYYDSAKYINIAGRDYSEESKYYNPERVRGAEMDISIAQNTSSPAYRSVMDTFLMELMRGGAISLKMFLENTTLPFKDRLLQAVVAEEERMQQAQAAQMGGGGLPPAASGAGGGISPELMQQVEQGVDPAAMEALRRGMGN